jgi:addiction module HigA family antidote
MMIKTFRSKELSKLWATGKSRIDIRMHKRILTRLNTLDTAATIEGLSIQGYDFHALRGFAPTRYSIHINGPWCITFEFFNSHAYQVDFEQYH